MRRVWHLLGFAFCLLLTVASVVNVLGEHDDIVARAEQAACNGTPAGCTPRLLESERYPWAHVYTFQVAKGTSVVRCSRWLIVAGEFSCQKQNR